jgi:hypothetical protein
MRRLYPPAILYKKHLSRQIESARCVDRLESRGSSVGQIRPSSAAIAASFLPTLAILSAFGTAGNHRT